MIFKQDAKINNSISIINKSEVSSLAEVKIVANLPTMIRVVLQTPAFLIISYS